MEKITELKTPAISNTFYLVPCLLIGDRKFQGFKKGEYCPVLLSWHKDLELGVEAFHYHYDFRFINPSANITHGLVLNENHRNSDNHSIDFEIHWRKKKCFDPDASDHTISRWLWGLDSTKALRMKDNVCPHHGFSLHSIPVHNGCVTCPIHGLKWDCTTGKSVS